MLGLLSVVFNTWHQCVGVVLEQEISNQPSYAATRPGFSMFSQNSMSACEQPNVLARALRAFLF